MGFRRDHDAALEWRRWVQAHEAELVAIGIPREVWADRMTWWRFVYDGCHPPETRRHNVRFAAADLPESQLRRLYVFLDTILPADRSSSSLWTVLHRRFGTASQTEPPPA